MATASLPETPTSTNCATGRASCNARRAAAIRRRWPGSLNTAPNRPRPRACR